MGLLSGHEVFGQWLPKIQLEHIVATKPVNIYIDGLLYLFCGVVGHESNNITIANTAYYTILHHINKIKEAHIDIHKIYFILDGQRPAIKCGTSELRRKRIKLPFDLNESKVELIRLLSRVDKMVIKPLTIGEAEMDAFMSRDVSRPSFILTDDSDLIHIAYGYTPQTSDDHVYILRKKLQLIYDCAIPPSPEIPSIAFKTLAFSTGSDFTTQLFTKSMVLTVRQKLITDPQCITHLQQLCHGGVVTSKMIESLLYYYLCICLNCEKARLNQSKDLTCTAPQYKNYIATMMWSVNYSLRGTAYQAYSLPLEPLKFNQLHFYHLLARRFGAPSVGLSAKNLRNITKEDNAFGGPVKELNSCLEDTPVAAVPEVGRSVY